MIHDSVTYQVEVETLGHVFNVEFFAEYSSFDRDEVPTIVLNRVEYLPEEDSDTFTVLVKPSQDAEIWNELEYRVEKMLEDTDLQILLNEKRASSIDDLIY